MSVFYGPDSFTVGADTTLPSYNAGWVRRVDTGTMDILNADDYCSNAAGNTAAIYAYEGSGSPNGGNQKITGNLFSSSGAEPALCVRVAAGQAYALSVREANGYYRLYKVSGTTWSFLTNTSTINWTSGAWNTVSLKASDNGANVDITISDGTNTEIYTDTTSPFTTGYIGIGFNDSTFGAHTNRIDLVSGDDLAGGGGGGSPSQYVKILFR